MTTTSEAPYLPPPSPSPPQSAATPRSARPGTPSRQSLSPGKRNLSPSKSRNTPGRVSAKSPRKSPSKNVQSIKSVSFTPQRTKQPPRAWERRPATPFIPRDEKQKIWKRVPLGELGVDVNRPVGNSSRQLEASKDYARVVKKLKVGHIIDQVQEGEDKENVNRVFAVGLKVLSEQGNVKRMAVGKGGRYDFVTMRMEEDEIKGSPKKKLRRPVSETNMHIEDHKDQRARGVEGGTEHETDGDLSFDEEECDFAVCCEEAVGQELNSAEDEKQQTLSEAAHVEETPEQHNDGLHETVEQSEITQQVPVNCPGGTATASDKPSTITATSPFKPVANKDEEDDAAQSGAEVEVAPQEGERLQQDAAGSDPIEFVDEAIEDQLQLPLTSVVTDISEQDEIVDSQEAATAVFDGEQMVVDEEISGDDIGSSSPPTILVENVTIDELAARDSPTSARTKTITDDESDEQPEEQETPGMSTTHEALPRRISDDETAFLREFMSRTKATKAERAARDQALLHAAQDETAQAGAEQEQIMSENKDDLSQIPTLEPAAQEDTAHASPLRRSKRAAATSIPRPQSLPNSIQLKRANGNEFIFKANQASSTANVAMTTRSNTKKNKGTALNVPARLEQLLAERAKEDNGNAQQVIDTLLETALAEISSEKASKKRKRDKNDTGTKAKKVLRWNDEDLVSYQEAERNLEWEDIEDSSQGSLEEQSKENVQPGQDKHVKLRFTVASGSNSDSETSAENPNAVAEEKDTEARPQQKEQKLRKVRRGIAGSINGTPAPKTRSRKIVDEDDLTVDVPAEQGASAEVSDAAAAALKSLAGKGAQQPVVPPTGVTTTRKSRMPVPSSSRRGAAASASVRTAPSTLPARATAAATAAGEKEKTRGTPRVRTAQEKEKEGESGDLLGRRRLRVRS